MFSWNIFFLKHWDNFFYYNFFYLFIFLWGGMRYADSSIGGGTPDVARFRVYSLKPLSWAGLVGLRCSFLIEYTSCKVIYVRILQESENCFNAFIGYTVFRGRSVVDCKCVSSMYTVARVASQTYHQVDITWLATVNEYLLNLLVSHPLKYIQYFPNSSLPLTNPFIKLSSEYRFILNFFTNVAFLEENIFKNYFAFHFIQGFFLTFSFFSFHNASLFCCGVVRMVNPFVR